jgi:predicted transcriptional regulator
MKSYTRELGELQQKILKHMVECKEESQETVNHIAERLNLAQPTVFKSVQLLIEGNYVESHQEYKRGPKILILTDKGAAAGIMSGVDLNKYESHEKSHGSNLIKVHLDFLGKITTTPERRNLMFQRAMEYHLKNNIFENGYLRDKTPEQEKKFVQYIASEYVNSLGPASNIKTFEEFVDRYQVDKEFLKTFLIHQKEIIDKFVEKLNEK